ncbi:hypothetical protein [Clostridium thermobutyricum]|uniref:hypothetical protein n=1 Tax=Clostridium thermobutyricum TaxID=29372 RepID=UPI0018AB3067|nr:hypothetical protein [Clostridium thermobutyricum]
MKKETDSHKTKKTFNKKGTAIAVTAVMTTALLQPIAAHATTLKKENEVKGNDSEQTNYASQGPVNLNVSIKSGTFIPQGTNGDAQSEISYKFTYQFTGNTGKIENIQNVQLKPILKMSYNNSEAENSPFGQQLLKLANSLNGQYNFEGVSPTIYGTTNLNSTSTGEWSYTIATNILDHNTQFTGSFEVSYQVNGKTYTQIVKAPVVPTEILKSQIYIPGKISMKQINYTSKFYIGVGLPNIYYSLDNVPPTDGQVPGYYGLAPNKDKSIDINLNITDNPNITINPKYSKYITSLGNDNYRIDTSLFKYNQNNESNSIIPDLFIADFGKVKNGLNISATLTPSNLQYNGGLWGSITYGKSNCSIAEKSEQGTLSIQNTANTSVNPSANISSIDGFTQIIGLTGGCTFKGFPELKNEYNIQNVSLLENGYYPVSYQGKIIINPNAKYFVINDSTLANDNGDENENLSDGLSLNKELLGILKGNSGVKIYTGQQLIDMYKKGESIPEVNAAIVPNGYKLYGFVDASSGDTLYQSNIAIGIGNSNSKNSLISQAWSKVTNSNTDSIYTNADGTNDFVIGSYGYASGMVESNSGYNTTEFRGAVLSDGTTMSLSQANSRNLNVTINGDNGGQSIGASDYYGGVTGSISMQTQNGTPTYNIDNKDNKLIINTDVNNVNVNKSYITCYVKVGLFESTAVNLPLSEFTKGPGNTYYISVSKIPGFQGIANDGEQITYNFSFTNLKPPTDVIINAGVASDVNAFLSAITSSYDSNNLNGSFTINGKTINEQIPLLFGTDNIAYTSVANNSCSQKVTNVDTKDKEFTINNSISNNSDSETQYYGIGRIPTNTTSTLGSTYGDNGIGKTTTSTLTGIDIPDGGEVYLIPKSLENKYNEVMNTQNISDMSSLQEDISNPNSGVVKYTPNMDLSNYVGYIFKSPIVKAGQTFNMGFRIKCSGLTPNVLNTMYTGFKYYDYSHNYGSISQINELNLSNIFNPMKYKDVLNLSTNDGSPLPPNAQFGMISNKLTTVSANKATQVIGNFPIHRVVLFTGTIPGYVVVSNNETQTVDKKDNTTINTTNYVFHKLENTITYKAIDQDGNIVKGVEANVLDSNNTDIVKNLTNAKGIDKIGTNVVSKVETVSTSIPKGYILDGSVTLTQSTDKYGEISWVAVQKLKKLAPAEVTTKVVDSQGKVLVNEKIYNGFDTEGIGYSIPKIPQGYHLVKVTDNGKDYTPNKDSEGNGTIIGSKDVQNLVWEVEKNESPVSIVYMDGNTVVVPKKDTTVKTGASLGVTIEIPTGYKEVGITYNGNKTDNKAIDYIKAIPSGNNIIVQLTKLHETVATKFEYNGEVVNGGSIEVLGQNNKVIKNTSGELPFNSVTGGRTITVPAGYQDFGTPQLTITTDKDGNEVATIVQQLQKLPPAVVTTQVVDQNNKVIVPLQKYNGYDGEKLSYNVPNIPKGYEVTSITDNGNDYSPNTSLLKPGIGSILGTDGTQNIVWHVQNKETTVTVTYKYGNKEIGSPVTSQIKTGSNLNKTKITIPEGYKEVSVNVNGKQMPNNQVEGIASPNPNKIVVNLQKLHETVNVTATCDGQEIPGVTFNLGNSRNMISSNKVVSKVFDYNSVSNVIVSAIPEGYKLDGNISISKTTDKEGNEIINAVQKLTKIPKNSITVSMVNSQGDIIIKPQTVTNYDGEKVDVPTLQVPKGYKLVNITENNKIINKVPNTIGTVDQNIVYHVIKENTTINIKYMYNGKEIGNPVKKDIKTGSEITNSYINTPNGYKIDNITFNGATVKNNELNNKALPTPNTVIVNLTKLHETVNVSAVCDGKEVPNAVIDVDGNTLTTSTSIVSENIAYGTFKDAKTINIPTGYEIDGDINITKTTDKDGNITINVIQNLKKLASEKVTTEVKDVNGNVLVPVISYSGYEGSDISYKIPTIPNGYEVVKVTDNGNAFTPKTGLLHPNTGVLNDVKDTQHLVWIVQNKETSVTVHYEYNGKDITTPETTKIKTGSDLDKTKLTIPTGYNIQSIDVNGNQMKDNKIVGTASPNPNTIIVNLGKLHETVNVTATCNGVDVSGVVVKANIGDITTSSSVVSKQVDYNSYKSAIVSSIPEGYQQDGKVVVSTSIDKDGNQIVNINVPLKKLAKGTVTTIVKDTTGNIIDSEKSYTGYENTKDTAVVPTIPQGYKVISITNNSVKCSGLPKYFNNSTQNIVWTVEKENTNVTVEVINKATGKEICTPEIENIKTGSELSNVKLPSIGEQWKIVNVTVNGKSMSNNKVTGTALPTPNKIIITVEQKSSVTTEITSDKGKVLVPSKTTIVNEGSSVTPLIPSIPSGYHIDKIKVGNKDYKTIKDIPQTVTKTENINIIVSKNTYTDSVTVKDVSGKTIVPTKTITGIAGTPTGINIKDLIPKGYKVISVIDNNIQSTISDSAIKNVQDKNTNVVITVEAQPQVTTEVKTVEGKVLVQPKTVTVDNNSSLQPLVPEVPNGYHLVKVVVNNKDYNAIKDIPSKVTQNDKVEVIVAENTYTTKVTVKDENGTVIMPTKVITGVPGTSTGLDSSNLVPQGYKVVSVTDNNLPSNIDNNAISKITNSNNNIVITVKKEQFKVSTVVKDLEGNIVTPQKDTLVPYGSTLHNLIPNCPSGYIPVKIVVNNKDFNDINSTPSTVTSNDNVTVIVKKIVKGIITTQVKDVEGNTIVGEKSYEGVVGDNDTAVAPTIPNGYKLIGITNNGNKVNGLPATFEKNTQNLVWIVEKIPTIVKAPVNVKIITTSGQQLGTVSTSEANVGSDLGNSYMPNIPNGYKVVKVTTDGVNTGLTPNGKVVKGENNIIVTVQPIITKVPVSVTVKTNTGNILIPTSTTEVNKGTPLTGKLIPSIPEGYKVDSIIVNGTNETTGITGVANSNTNIVVIVSKLVKGSINVVVKDTTGNIVVPSVSATGAEGSKDTLQAPIIPQGYKVVSITNNGITVKGMPDTFTGQTQNVVYTVQKIDTKLTTEIVTTTGQVLQQPETRVVKIGVGLQGLTPVCPQGYKVVSINVNGEIYTNIGDINGLTTSTPSKIILTVSKINPKPVTNQGKVTVVVRTIDGKVLLTEAPTEGEVGSSVTSSIPTIPAGYKLVMITNNGNKVNGLPSKYTDGTQNIIYVVEKIPTVNKRKISIVTKSSDGKILVGESSVSGTPGTPTGLGLDIPQGYHLVKIIDNGKEIKSLPEKFNNENQNIEIIVEKNKDNMVKTINNELQNNLPNNTPNITVNNTPNTSNTNNHINNTNIPTNNPTKISSNNQTNNPINTTGKSNPKTGDTSELPFALGILAALGALIGINVKRKKPSTEKIDK